MRRGAPARTAFLLIALTSTSAAGAPSGGHYSLEWNTLDGGGATFAVGGGYRLGGTVGQPDAGLLSAGGYTLGGGFWGGGSGSLVDIDPVENTPRVFAARPAAPNPFFATTTLSFDLPASRQVRVTVHGIDGRRVRQLIAQELGAGRHRAVWDGRDEHGQPVSPGIYFARIQAGEFASAHRVVRLD
jgi:hypothetical protein